MGKKSAKKGSQASLDTKTSQIKNFKVVALVSVLIVFICALIPAVNNYLYQKGDAKISKTWKSSKLAAEKRKEQKYDDNSVVTLVDILDSYLMTALSARPPVSIETVNLLIQDAQEKSSLKHQQPGSSHSFFDVNHPIHSSNEQGTGGELTLLGYAILLHDVQFVNELLFPTMDKLSALVSSDTNMKSGVNPMAYVGLPPNVLQQQQANGGRGKEKNFILGSFHEAALSDSFRPLHLALITKDVAVDAARKFLLRASSNRHCSERLLSPALLGPSHSNVSNHNHDNSIIGKILQLLPPCFSESDNEPESTNHNITDTNIRYEVPLKELILLIHEELIEPMLLSLFKAIKEYPMSTSSSTKDVSESGGLQVVDDMNKKEVQNTAVIAALRTKDRWGRTPLHLAVLSGNSAACALIMKEWLDAVVNLKELEMEKEARFSRGSDEVNQTVEKLPPGFECWLLGAVDQLNRTALHYSGMRGDENMLSQLLTNSSPSPPTTTLSEYEALVRNSLISCAPIAQLPDVNGQIAKELLEIALKGRHLSNHQIDNKGEEEGASVVIDSGDGSANVSPALTDQNASGGDGESGGWDKTELELPTQTTTDHSASITCDFQVVEAKDMSPKRFLLEFLSASRPVLIKGAALDWNFRTHAVNRWDKDKFIHRFGSFEVMSSSIPYARSFGMNSTTLTIKEYVEGFSSQPTKHNVSDTKTSPNYVFTDRPHPQMLRDFPLVPPFLKIAKHLIDPIPASIQFYLGPAGSGSPWHWHGDAWNAIAFGQKRWSLLPPAKATFSNKHSYHTHYDLPITRVSNGSDTKSGGSDIAVGVTDALHCMQEAGDVIYVPTGWAHAILNTKETLGVAEEFRYTFNHFA